MLSARNVARYDVFDFERIADETGNLYVGELAQLVNRSFGRIYFITSVPPGAVRGGHAHKQQAECLICVQGRVVVRVEAGGRADDIVLGRPGRALYLPPGYWRDLVDFSPDAVLVVLASEPFDESDYIRDRPAFLRWEAAGAP
jgi:dTDP-4-dehydrorhamnose 3,5-epimerase-like enzyme